MLKPQTRPIDPKDMIFETTESICFKSVLKLNGRINPSQSLNPWFFTIPLQKSANTANIPHTHDEFNRQNTRCYRQTKRICKNSISEPHPPEILSKNLQLYTQIRHNAQFSQKKQGAILQKPPVHDTLTQKFGESPMHHLPIIKSRRYDRIAKYPPMITPKKTEKAPPIKAQNKAKATKDKSQQR